MLLDEDQEEVISILKNLHEMLNSQNNLTVKIRTFKEGLKTIQDKCGKNGHSFDDGRNFCNYCGASK